MLQGLRVVLACSGVALQNRKSSNERICVATSSDRSVISFGCALRWGLVEPLTEEEVHDVSSC
jgi:hypothetical protein